MRDTQRVEPLTGCKPTISRVTKLTVAERAWGDGQIIIKDWEILTCHQIGLDRQSHYAHKDVTAELAIPSPNPFQLWYDGIGIEQSASDRISPYYTAVEMFLHDKTSRMR